jgi:hypothetical protein
MPRRLFASVILSLAGGCAFPYFSQQALPEVARHVPADFAADGTEVLALTLLSSDRGRSPWYGEPLIDKRTALPAMMSRLKRISRSGMMHVDYGLKGQGVMRNDAMVETVSLAQLCLLAANGRTLRFSMPGPEGWSEVQAGVLAREVRIAMLQALRERQSNISAFEGPCSGQASLDWSEEQRAQVEAFLARMNP